MDGRRGGPVRHLRGAGGCRAALLALALLALHLIPASGDPGGDVGTFIQFGDVHYDQDYSVDSSLSRYCRGVVPPNQRNGCQPFGTPLSGADSPLSILVEVANQLGSLTNQLKPDFVLWSGDTGRHDATSPQDIYTEASVVTSLLRKATNNYPWVIPLLGNNDCYDNCVGFKENGYINGNFSRVWDDYLKHADSGNTFPTGGYMYSKVSDHLIVLSLNTMLWTERNCALTDDTACGLPNSPGSAQFEWMEKVLTDPAHKNMNFILHGHIPPLAPPLNGDKVYFPTCLQRYYNFTSAHKDRIKGHLYADQHVDTFYLMPDNVGTILVNPAVVPLFNTGIRVYSYNRKTGDLLNYWQHYINITKANERNAVVLELEYSPLSPFTAEQHSPIRRGFGPREDPPGYGLRDLSLASWEWLNHMIVSNYSMQELFKQYYFVSYPVPPADKQGVSVRFDHWTRHNRRGAACYCQPWTLSSPLTSEESSIHTVP